VIVAAVIVGVICALASGWVAWRSVRQRGAAELAQLRARTSADAAAITKAGQRAAETAELGAETAAREAALDLRQAEEAKLAPRLEDLVRRGERLAAYELQASTLAETAAQRLEALKEQERGLQSVTDRAKGRQGELGKIAQAARQALEEVAGSTGPALKSAMVEAWREDALAEVGQRLRQIDASAADPDWGRQAQRVMGIAVGRYHAHFLTERLLSNVPLPPGMADFLVKDDQAVLKAIEEGSGVKLELHESGEKVRLDSGDGVAREVVRRALNKLIKGSAPRSAQSEPVAWVKQIAANLDREIMDLGKRAFTELKIPKAHPEIVALVGRLNYRTSYTQNQWKHAMEAAHLGGMMAAELGLDVKLMLRATLMHDIGKSLTHQIEGSHAVIGADYARRLGEAEIVANAIGAHHADEPPNSVYAYLVAAADAMSGARPGARREQTEAHSTKLEDLERIGSQFRGVERAFAVQGGREVRVYVKPEQVSDLGAVELSSEIAAKIGAELTFPGQIKVTVIREREAVAVAS
jgi:ribonuclease Y